MEGGTRLSFTPLLSLLASLLLLLLPPFLLSPTPTTPDAFKAAAAPEEVAGGPVVAEASAEGCVCSCWAVVPDMADEEGGKAEAFRAPLLLNPTLAPVALLLEKEVGLLEIDVWGKAED